MPAVIRGRNRSKISRCPACPLLKKSTSRSRRNFSLITQCWNQAAPDIPCTEHIESPDAAPPEVRERRGFLVGRRHLLSTAPSSGGFFMSRADIDFERQRPTSTASRLPLEGGVVLQDDWPLTRVPLLRRGPFRFGSVGIWTVCPTREFVGKLVGKSNTEFNFRALTP